MILQNLLRCLFTTVAPLAAASAMSSEAHPAGHLTARSFLQRPKLILVVVIDQFRADYLTRFEKRFIKPGTVAFPQGGFRYLMDKGAYFPFAEFDVLQNMTCPGHATILTGALPYAHHIPLNEWYDEKSHHDVYCVDAPEAPVVGPHATAEGVSPHFLQASTVGDELKNAGYASRVVAISLKDRAAVMLGGHRADLALWFDLKEAQWMTSRYYAPSLPPWVTTLNQELQKRAHTSYKWKQSSTPETGLSNPYDKGPFERDVTYLSPESLRTPVGLEITTDAAVAALHAYQLGKPADVPDLLAVSYSTHDMLGHKVGPNAREMEELTVAEDENLARLFREIDRSVPGGLKSTLIVLTGDHGMAPSVPYAMSAHFAAAMVDQEALRKQLNEHLKTKLGQAANGLDWVNSVHSFNFYFNHLGLSSGRGAEGTAEKKVTRERLEIEAKNFLRAQPAAESVFAASDVQFGTLPPADVRRQIMNSYVPQISGDVVMVPKPYFVEDGEPAMHMTGYSYDRTVPVAIAGPHLRAGVYAQKAHVIDIAPTLSFLLGIIPPSKNEGRVLAEAIGD